MISFSGFGLWLIELQIVDRPNRRNIQFRISPCKKKKTFPEFSSMLGQNISLNNDSFLSAKISTKIREYNISVCEKKGSHSSKVKTVATDLLSLSYLVSMMKSCLILLNRRH